MVRNSNLSKAKKAKNDEFYTQLEDIEKELRHYDFTDKTIYCNCDNPNLSNFYKYFKLNFHYLKINKLICTGYNPDGNGFYGEYDGENEIIKQLDSNGDFRSAECIGFLKECDVVVTNPPFSLFREYVAQLMEYGKKFIIIGNMNAITYKKIFPYIKNNELWLGNGFQSGNAYFLIPPQFAKEQNYADGVYNADNGLVKFRNCVWFTNVEYLRRNPPLDLYRKFNETDYPKYDNYDAIEVSRVENIPMDYEGIMGVPITFLDKYCPTQFEILWLASGHSKTTMPKEIAEMLNANFEMKSKENTGNGYAILNGHQLYHRILIRRR